MKESMVIYESAYKAISYLPDEKLQLEALKGLMEYGFYDIIPESSNPFVQMIFVQAIPSMRSAKERYERSVENGKKGGRPAAVPIEDIIKMKQEGMTNKQIADKLGCSEKNIEKRLSTYNKAYPTNPTNHPTNPIPQDSGVHPNNPTNPLLTTGLGGGDNDDKYPTNPTNLSVSDTVSESVSETASSTDTGTASSASDADNICPEEKSDLVSEEELKESKEYYFQGDWRALPDDMRRTIGRQIRDLTDDECREIEQLLEKGETYINIEHQYGMRSRTITKDFRKNRMMFNVAYAEHRIPRKF